MSANLRSRAGLLALRLASRLNEVNYIGLDYAPSVPSEPRWGHGRAVHPRLAEIIDRDRETYAEHLRLIGGYTDALRAIPLRSGGATEPFWLNAFLPGLDCASLYAFLRAWAPRRYLEIGSGNSTMWAARARCDGALDTRITSIDPSPRVGIDALCDLVVRSPLETCDLAMFWQLSAGDVLFVDGSHRSFPNSDTTVFFLDILPELAPGVRVCVHDILLPEDYPPQWATWFYSEQYLFASWLLAEGSRLRPLLACNYSSLDRELPAILAALWDAPELAGVSRHGYGFWFELA